MTVPYLPGVPQALPEYLQSSDDRLSALETPQGPGTIYACNEADLPDPNEYPNCSALVSDGPFLAITSYNAGLPGWEWLRADGSAL